MVVCPAKVLIVDDDPHVCRLIEDVLSGDHFCCASVNSGEQAKRLLLEDRYDVVVVDLLMPGVSGIDLLKFISSQSLRTRAICVTGAASTRSMQDALDAGAFAFFEKPLDVSHLIESVRLAADACAGERFDTDLARQAIEWRRNNPSKLILPEKNSRIKTA